MVLLNRIQAIVLSLAVSTSVFAAAPQSGALSGKDLQQLVAPIALYPDQLVAQVLAGSTYPTQVVEAEKWLHQNSNLKGEQLAAEVDKQSWDPSIKALTQFPSVLQNMSKSLDWTSALGEAYFSNPDSVMSAIQTLRTDAKQKGTLESTPEQTVSTQGQTIVIEPAQQDTVYVPSYSPEVYGVPMEPYPGYSGWGTAAASAISFGVGTAIGAAAGGWGWGWGHWGTNWHGGSVTYNRNNFVSRSNTFVNRNGQFNQANRVNNTARNFNNQANNAARNFNTQQNRPGANQLQNRPNAGTANRSAALSQAQNFSNRERASSSASRGFGGGGVSSAGTRSGSFSGFSQGGSARMASARGAGSFSGGGGRVGGGGGRVGGGGRAGGGGRR
jgi:hypothetical protein